MEANTNDSSVVQATLADGSVVEIVADDDDKDMGEIAADLVDDVRMEEGDDEQEGVELDNDEFEPLPGAGFTEHHESVFCVAFHPTDSSILASGGGDDKAYLWTTQSKQSSDSDDKKDLVDCSVLYEYAGHTDSIVDIGFNFDGSLLATAGMDATVRIWSVNTGKLVKELSGPGAEIEWISWHPKGNVILAGSADTTTWMWNALNGKCMQVFSGHIASVRCGKFDKEGKVAITASEDGTAFVWNPKTGESKQHLKGTQFHDGAPITVLDVAYPLLATASEDGSVLISQIKTGKILGAVMKFEEGVEALAFSPDEKWLAAGDMSGRICVMDVASSKVRLSFAAHSDGITRLKWLPSGDFSTLVSVSMDMSVKVWDVRNGVCIKEWEGAHQQGILDVDVDSTGKKIVTAGDDGVALVFDL
eukprot:TRINITY_DN884_c0_g1_i1.p1 TRINITY_DN884_c0_g1~~TRINITY_DN884_c0_g1_i1.p1  ORF type:complete len:418 (-),score=114.52 TRINITY_DN884_c0_g1_i1:77-1330(-)